MNKIIILKIDFSILGNKDFIYPVVMIDKENVVLVDCGYIGSLELIERELLTNDIQPTTLTHLLITHHDHDHMGTAFDMKQKYPQIKIVASEKETPYISGKIKSPRLVQAENMQKYLPEEQKAFGEKFCEVLRSIKSVDVDIQAKDGDIFDWCCGSEIIETYGHTSGHISLFIQKENILIAGDAATIENNELVIVNPKFTLDLKKANKSLNFIKNMNAKKIICYHGGFLEN